MLAATTSTEARIVTGAVNTPESFYYVASFCFNKNTTTAGVSTGGTFNTRIYHHINVTYGLAVYFQGQDNMLHIFNDQSNCLQRIAYAGNNYFTTKTFETVRLKGNKTHVASHQNFHFHVARPRWFYIVLTNCNYPSEYRIKKPKPEDLKNSDSICQGPIHADYEFTMLNGLGDYKHFSFNEFDDPALAIIFFLLYIVLFAVYVFITTCLTNKAAKAGGLPNSLPSAKKDDGGCSILSQHKTVNFLGTSILLKLIANLIDVARFDNYANTGIKDNGYREAETLSLILHHTMDVILVLNIMLIAKGWTVIRRKISASGRVKLAMVMTTYYVCGIGAVIMYSNLSDVDRIEQSSIYLSQAGLFVVLVRVAILCWYIYAAFTTFGKPSFRRKKHFYKIYFPAALTYLLLLPCTYAISLAALPYNRSKIVNWVTNIGVCIAHAGFLYLFWPSNYNSFFPFAFETKEQEMARVEALKQRSRSMFNRTESVVASTNSGIAENNFKDNSNSDNFGDSGFGPQYSTSNVANKSSVGVRASRASVSGGSQGLTSRANITRLSTSLRNKIKVIYDYSEDLDEAINVFFEEEGDVDIGQ